MRRIGERWEREMGEGWEIYEKGTRECVSMRAKKREKVPQT